jgi:4-carboxymuconolactone decarboxylase
MSHAEGPRRGDRGGPRVPLLPDPLPERVLADAILREDGTPLNLFRVLGYHPRLLSRLARLGALLLRSGDAPFRDRELAILRVAARSRCHYQFNQHAVVGARCGISDEEIERIASGEPLSTWREEDREILAMTDQLIDDADIHGSTFESLCERLGFKVVLELIVTVGNYRMIATIMNATNLPLEVGPRHWELAAHRPTE